MSAMVNVQSLTRPPSRAVTATHLRGEYKACPICQHAIALDHEEALKEQARREGVTQW